MNATSKIESSEYSDLNKVIGWFLALRWIACGGVFVSQLVIHLFFHYNLPNNVLFTFTGLLFIANLSFTIYYILIKSKNLSRKELKAFFHIQVCSDYVLLFLLSYLTGFLENPLCYYFVFHIMLTSFIFSSTIVYIYVGSLLVMLISVMAAEFYRVIPHFPLNPTTNANYFDVMFIRGAGLCTTLIIAAYLITSIKRRIEERGRKIEFELDRYKSLDKIKSNFILQVTHEIRGPIAALKGFHEMILKGITGETTQRTRETLQKANRRTENLLTMIDEMIDYAYMKAEEKIKYGKTGLYLKNIIDANIDLFLNAANEKDIQVASNCSRDLSLITSRDLMNIIFSNLISNAIKYSPAKTTVRVNAEKDKDKVHIMVKDEGIGIKSDELDRIFEEFYRTRRAREIVKDGTGLGLSIVQKAVEALNGKISVYSEEGKGTTFHIYLPSSNPNGTKNEKNQGGNNEQ